MLQWYEKLEWLNADEVKLWFTDGYGCRQFLTWHRQKTAQCTCGKGSCIHQQFLTHTIDVESLAPTGITQQDNPASSKDERRAERITKLDRALDELAYWLDDSLSRGLAAQIQEQAAFAEGLAVRMADASLTSLHRRLIELQTTTAHALQNNQPLPVAWADLLFLLRAGKRQQVLPQPLWHELCQTLGITIRKEEVRNANHRITDIFTVTGVEKVRLEPRLHQRTTWLYAHQRGTWHSLIEFEFEGTTWLPAALPVGYRFEATAFAYPSVFYQRLHFDEIPELPSNRRFTEIPPLKTFAEAMNQFAKQLTALPWHTECPVLFDHVAIRYHLGSWYLADATGAALPISSEQTVTQQQLYAKTGGKPDKLFCIWRQNSVRVVSAW